jgi:hypothetical protein
MGIIRSPIPVKLFVGMLSPDPSLFDASAEIIDKEYGPVDHHSGVLPWSNTEYYHEEMGPGIVRKFLFLKPLRKPDELPDMKIFTDRIEKMFSIRTEGVLQRRINLDPGYVTEAKVVLATAKDFSHRIYIGKGIYAEVTLRYSVNDRSFMPFDHTYPDYRTETYRTLFNEARNVLRTDLKHYGG